MGDAQLESIFVTFAFDMGIFLVELLVFFCIRNKRDKGNVLLNWVEPQNEAFREFDPNDLRPSMNKELQFESRMLEAKQDVIHEVYDLTAAKDAKKEVAAGDSAAAVAINQTMEMTDVVEKPVNNQRGA